MATITATASGGTRNWSDTATWVGGVVPGASDDVVLASTSGNVTINAAAACRSLDCAFAGNYAGTLSHAASVVLSVGDGTAGAGIRALRFSATMTYTPGNTASQFSFISTSATQQTLTSAGKTLSKIAIGGNASKNLLLADALTLSSSIDHSFGTFDTGNQPVSCTNYYSSYSNTRTLTLGSSTITCTGNSSTTAWDTSTPTNATITANTASIVVNNGGGMNVGALNMNGASLSYTATTACTINNAGTWASVTISNTAVKTASIGMNANMTVTGTLTVNANSLANALLIQSNAVGTARTVTAAAVSFSGRVDFQDIVGAGAASWVPGAASLGDCGGNSGITFTPSVTRYAVAAGNWSSTAVWSASSGGASGASVPLPQDNAVLNASSGVGTITIDMPRACKDLTCTGYTGTLTANTPWAIYGSSTLASSMTFTHNSQSVSPSGRGSHTLTCSGKQFGSVNVNAVGGSYSQADAYVGAFSLNINYGSWTTNGFSVAASAFNAGGGTTVNLGASTLTLSSSSTPLSINGGTTLNAGTSTIVLADTSASTKTFAGGGKVYNNLVIQGGALNSVVITGANTFNNVSAPAGTVLTLPASTTTTATGTVDLTGTRYNGLRLPGVSGNYISTPDAAALRITGDLEIVVRASAVDWTPIGGAGGTAQLIAKRSGSEAWSLGVLAGGAMQVVYRDPTNTATRAYSVNLGSLADGATYWIKITRNATTGTISSYVVADQATEPASWGAAIGTAASTVETIYAGTAPLEIGSRGAGTVDPWTGTMYRAIVRNGIGGTTVFDADFTSKPWGADTFTCTTGQTVTINGDLAKAGDGRVMLVSSTPGTAATLSKASGVVNGDYLAVRDVTATGGATFNAGVRSTLSNATGWNATGTLNKVATFTLGLAPRAFVSKSVGVAALFPLGLMPRDAATAGAARPITWQRLDVGANA